MKVKTLLYITILFILFSGCVAYATDIPMAEISKGVDLNEFVPDEFKDKIHFTPDESVEEKVEKALGVLNINSILESLKTAFVSSFGQAIKAFTNIFGIIIISSVMGIYKSSFGDKFSICESVSTLALCLCCFQIVTALFDKTQYAAQRLCIIAQSLFASMCGLSMLGGEIVGAGITDGTSMVIISLIQGISVNIIFPVIKLCLTLSICSCLCTEINLNGVVTPVKTICNFALGAMTTLFSTVLFLQKSVTLSGDSMNLRLSKFALTSLVPVVGGIVGESLRTVLGSISVVKNLTGILGICSLFYFIVPPLCTILVYKFAIIVCAFFSKIIGLSRQSQMLYDLNSVINIMNSVLLCVTLTFVIASAIMMLSIRV